ncbi:MAG: HAD family hydrolase, partial [Burkholderiales bacterium]|nr:HAD family hydrolase [Burkholderiales bacterium]
MKLTDFKVLTFDVVGTLIDFERGVLASVRRLGGPAANDLTDDQIFEPYMRGRAAFPGRSSHAMAHVYLSLAKELGLPDDAQSAAAFQRDVLEWPAFP